MYPDSSGTATSQTLHTSRRAEAHSGVVIPIRAFALGKARLADVLDPATRAVLARRWAERVVQAAAPLPVVVVSSDADVHEWAHHLGLTVLPDPGTLDAAAAAGRDHLRAAGCTRAVIAHADLPFAHDLAHLARDGAQPVVALVPCHRDDGTTVLSVPTEVEFRFAYGPDSFRRHAAEARRFGLALRVVRDRDLAFDVDIPDDLVDLAIDLAGDLEATTAP